MNENVCKKCKTKFMSIGLGDAKADLCPLCEPLIPEKAPVAKLHCSEGLCLRLRNAIVDKEWAVACANIDTAHHGEWQCDWHAAIKEANEEVESILKEMKA